MSATATWRRREASSIRERAWATSPLTSLSLLISIFRPISAEARRTFWPFLPMASESWSSSTTQSRLIVASSWWIGETRVILAGASAFCANVIRSSE